MNPFTLIKQHKLAAVFSIIAVILVSVAIMNRVKNPALSQNGEELPTVSLINVNDYRQQQTINLDNGIVQSLGQADLKSQVSAQIAAVSVKLGDRVSAGQTLVQMQNSDIRAQLEQAEARLDELKKGSRPEDIAISQTARDESQAALINSVKDAYAKSDDAIHNHIDKFFTDARQANAQFLVVTSAGGSQATFRASDTDLAIAVSKQKYPMEQMLADWKDLAMDLQPSSDAAAIENALALSKTNMQKEIDFLNQMAPLVNSLSSDNATYKQIIDGYKTEFSAARATVGGSMASLQGSETAWRSAQKALSLKLAGASAEQIRQSQAAVDALQAALAKTVVISPISGEISYISARVGELATPGLLLASVVNPATLKIKTYASENDLPMIAALSDAMIDGNAKGVVQSVSPAVDPQTKKAEVDILVTENGQPPIVIGQNVSVKISGKISGQNNGYLLPIQAVQFSGNENSVMAVNGDGAIATVGVTTGEVIGENIRITKGLSPDMKILSSVRGFKNGDKVNIQ